LLKNEVKIMSDESAVWKPVRHDDMEIYDGFKWPADVPKIPWDQLTLEQKKFVMEASRFGGCKPGTYQGVTFHGPNNSIP
jgi:hypothetical protein